MKWSFSLIIHSFQGFTEGEWINPWGGSPRSPWFLATDVATFFSWELNDTSNLQLGKLPSPLDFIWHNQPDLGLEVFRAPVCQRAWSSKDAEPQGLISRWQVPCRGEARRGGVWWCWRWGRRRRLKSTHLQKVHWWRAVCREQTKEDFKMISCFSTEKQERHDSIKSTRLFWWQVQFVAFRFFRKSVLCLEAVNFHHWTHG